MTVVNAIRAARPDANLLDGGDTWHGSMTCFETQGQNIFDAEWHEPSEDFTPCQFFERGGVKAAVIGQAFPYMPTADPGWMFPEYSFGIRDAPMQKTVDEVRDGRMMGFRPRLIPIFSNVITPDADVAAAIEAERAPFRDRPDAVLRALAGGALSATAGWAEGQAHKVVHGPGHGSRPGPPNR